MTKEDFVTQFLAKYNGSPRAKMVDLETDGLKPRSLLKKGISTKEGVYEFELLRRTCGTTPKDQDSRLTSSLLVQVLYGLGWPDKQIPIETMISKLRQWLRSFKRIGSKYGDYSWLDDAKIDELVDRTLGKVQRQIENELLSQI